MLACGALSCTSTHTCHARLVHVLLHSHSYVSYTTVRSCTSTRTSAKLLPVLMHLHSCYATARSLALAHICHATLLYVFLHLHACISSYTTVLSLALAHKWHATLPHALLHLHTCLCFSTVRFSCTCTHTYGTLRYVVFHLRMYMSRQATVHSLALANMSCYPTVRSLALAHIRHTTLLHVCCMHLHMYFLLRHSMFSCTRTHTHATLLRHTMHLSDCNWYQLDSGLPRSITTLQKGRLNPVWYEYT